MNKKLLPLVLALLARKRSVGGWITIAAIAVVYLMVQPILSAKLGIPLPGLFGSESSSAVASTDDPDSTSVNARTSTSATGDLVLKPAAPAADRNPASASPAGREDNLVAVANPVETQAGDTASKPKPSSKSKPREPQPQAPLGKLTEVGSKIFETTAGLRYGPGSVDGHRLLHVMEHAKDRPDKPVHGVFEGDEYVIRAVIDEAYLIADLKGPPQAKKTVEGQRTIWKVDMKRKVGYLGGEVGKRKRFPPLTGIQLVLEGVNVITAYPIDPRR